ncbi:PAS domain-containing protein [Roseomonas sp. BN140053]|uniref:PAS domain-containing protein n=1 Tax=Roseomonas sp. BN140053 TaxID=3391898 RepID=UPI0039E86CEB
MSGAEIAASGQGLQDLHVFRAAVQATRMPMVLADPNLADCPVVFANPAFCALTGYRPEEVLGRNCRFLQGPDTDPADVERIRRALAARESFDGEVYNYRKDGTGFWNALHLSPVFDPQGRLVYVFASQIDISARKEAARRQAQRAESIGALASGVAHEFNNLMTVVVGTVERAADLAADERQASYLRRADQAARRAGRLAAELLALARRQSGGEQAVDLNALARGAEARLAAGSRPGVPLRLCLAAEALPVRLDAGQLELVLANLVRNATEAIAGEGSITLATRAVPAPEAAALLNGNEAVELSVTDTGAGMTPEVLARATELFFTTKGNGEGTGLGLFLALEFVDGAGGRLAISSTPGRGTTVRLVFPRAAPN